MRQPVVAGHSRLFVLLASITVCLTVGLIVFGAIVRVTDSGLGCGDQWPLCNGVIFPPLDNLTAWIEWSHRLFALLIGVFGLGMVVVALRSYRRYKPLVLGITVVAAALYLVQSGLGAIVVILELPPTMVTLHLGTAMLLLGALIVAAIVARVQLTVGQERDHVTALLYVNTALSLVVILAGALVRGSGATLACRDWPLCNGVLWPFDQGQLQTVHMVHRLAVVGLGITLLLLLFYVWRDRADSIMRPLTVATLVAYLSQVGVGALFVLSLSAPDWGVAHVGLASVIWGLLVGLSTVETLNNWVVSKDRGETGWISQSDPTGKS